MTVADFTKKKDQSKDAKPYAFGLSGLSICLPATSRRPKVILQIRPRTGTAHCLKPSFTGDNASCDVMLDDSHALLLHKSMKVVLVRCPGDINGELELKMQDRHILSGFGSRVIRHWLNESCGDPDDSPKYQDLIEYVLDLAIFKKRRIKRRWDRNNVSAECAFYSLDHLHVASAAEAIFRRQTSIINDIQLK
ncbi:hypothetical protein HYALB_00012653 [Hymenoscyphus albidus]|uniref:Uncharacterized protein n=1 Tax=Hymenoscyphus albidus TaxID=595503 RepID=A0A9N9LNS1_9HELO|nr:hypothetical protein HYALB_00012653 [Hymenoscyphus albidus]